MADDATASQRDAFVSGAAARALDTPDKPLTPEAIERAWSAQHGFGKADSEGQSVLVLWNFDIASARLKLHHQKALKEFFGKVALARGSLAEDDLNYRVSGFASATGAERHNESISRRRAEVVAAFMSTEFGVEPLRIAVSAFSDHAQRGAVPPTDAGEWYARYRQVRVERIVKQVVPVPSRFDGPEPFRPGPVPPKPSTSKPNLTVVPVSFEFSVPPKGTFDVGGWLYVYASFSVQGKITLVGEGADSSAGIKGVISLNDLKKRKLKVEAEKKLTDNIKFKFGADIAKLSKEEGAGPGVKGALSFKSLGPFTNVEIGINLSRLTAPISLAKSWKESYELTVDGQPATFEAQLQGTLNIGLGPKMQARLGQMATQALETATVTEGGAAVGVSVAGPVAVGVGGVVVVCATLAGIAVALKEAGGDARRQAEAMARRHGFALTIAVEVLGHVPETDRYANAVDAEYVRIGMQNEFLAGRTDALLQIGSGNRQLRDALRAQYGDEVKKLHQALFLALGGMDGGDPDKEMRLADIPVRVP